MFDKDCGQTMNIGQSEDLELDTRQSLFFLGCIVGMVFCTLVLLGLPCISM
jgi:hypothetical protein